MVLAKDERGEKSRSAAMLLSSSFCCRRSSSMDVPLPCREEYGREKSVDGMRRSPLAVIGSAVLLAMVIGVNGMTRRSLGSMRPSRP